MSNAIATNKGGNSGSGRKEARSSSISPPWHPSALIRTAMMSSSASNAARRTQLAPSSFHLAMTEACNCLVIAIYKLYVTISKGACIHSCYTSLTCMHLYVQLRATLKLGLTRVGIHVDRRFSRTSSKIKPTLIKPYI